jgi:chitinase
VVDNTLDGVDVDWEDTKTFYNGTGELWLINFTTTLRQLLPNSIITHSPQAPYFGGKNLFWNGGYLAVHNSVGNLIDYYTIRFYNQGTTTYATAESLFNRSDGWASKTSVN